MKRPELALGVLALDDGEFDVEAFGVAVLGALQKAVLAGIAGADVHLHDGDRAVGDNVERALFAGSVVVVACHNSCFLSDGRLRDQSEAAVRGFVSLLM